jgi:hypothetical protein
VLALTFQGSRVAAGSVLTGSHCDAIPLAGMYDGTLGVIGAIEALAALKRSVSRSSTCLPGGMQVAAMRLWTRPAPVSCLRPVTAHRRASSRGAAWR